jgi:PKHD-type hydroxylase
MFLELQDFLKPEEVQRLREIAAKVNFVDGKVSNPYNQTKNNLQASESDPLYAESSRLVADAFLRSDAFQDFAFPRSIIPPLLARYDAGMGYGVHSDTAYIQLGKDRLRTDLAATVWLNPPESYDGGELIVHFGTRPVAVKGAPGSVVIYPSTQLHEVTKVTRGQRLVSITFIESRIPDAFQRTQLYELSRIAEVAGPKMDWDHRTRLDVVRNNLLRMWTRS